MPLLVAMPLYVKDGLSIRSHLLFKTRTFLCKILKKNSFLVQWWFLHLWDFWFVTKRFNFTWPVRGNYWFESDLCMRYWVAITWIISHFTALNICKTTAGNSAFNEEMMKRRFKCHFLSIKKLLSFHTNKIRILSILLIVPTSLLCLILFAE